LLDIFKLLRWVVEVMNNEEGV